MTFQVLKSGDSRWQELFAALPPERQDVFYAPGFAALCQETIHADHEVLCATWSGDGGVLLYPFVRRDLARLTGVETLAGKFDMISLYGRGGAAADPALTAEALASFQRQLRAWAADNRVICLFDRYHPVWANEAAADPETRIMDVGGFVAIDLADGIEAVEKRYKYSIRKDLAKAERGGVSTVIETDATHLDGFLDVYTHTMDRRHARDFYYFDREFFEGLDRHLPGQFFFIHALIEGKIVSTELVLKHGLFAHSFLGGTLREAQPHCPNHRLKRDLIRWLAIEGCRYFLLGGGSSENDGIFNYKRAFAPEGVLPSRIGGLMLDPAAYQEARDIWGQAGRELDARRFQFYDPN